MAGFIRQPRCMFPYLNNAVRHGSSSGGTAQFGTTLDNRDEGVGWGKLPIWGPLALLEPRWGLSTTTACSILRCPSTAEFPQTRNFYADNADPPAQLVAGGQSAPEVRPAGFLRLTPKK